MSNPFQRLRNIIFGPQHENGTYPGREGPYGAAGGDDARPVFTALDIGTAYAKALIIEVQDDVGVVLGVGRSSDWYSGRACQGQLDHHHQTTSAANQTHCAGGIGGHDLQRAAEITENRQGAHCC